MARLRCVRETERRDAVLEDVRECQEAGFGCLDGSEGLHGGAVLFDSVQTLKVFVVVLFVGLVVEAVGGHGFAEGEGGGRDVVGRVVVEG